MFGFGSKKSTPVNIQVIKRGRQLQFTLMLAIADETVPVSVDRTLIAGEKTGTEATDAFMEALLSGASNDDCFAAMEDRPDLDPEAELRDAIEKGKSELLSAARAELDAIVMRGNEASRLRAALTIGEATVVEPEDGQGVCRVCSAKFSLHHIAGTSDLCMNHINPGLI